MHYVYLLKSLFNKELYVGSTSNLRKRFKEHNDGKVISTKRYKPWSLVYYEAYLFENFARVRESKLKQHGNSMKELKKRVFLDQNKNGAGFTLVELLMSMGILTILIGVMTTLFGQIIDAGLDSQSTSGIDQDGKFIIARLTYDMQRASEIVTPAAPGSSGIPTLTIKINSIDYIYSLDGAGNLQLTNDLGVNSLNSHTTQVTDLSFQRLGSGNTTDTVQLKFRLTSKIKQTKGIETKFFQTTIGLQ